MNIKVVQASSIVLFLLTGLLIWQISDAYPNIAILQDSIKAQEETLKDSEATLKRLRELVVFTADNKEGIKKFDLILPGELEKENLISNLDNLATSNGLNTLKISFAPEAVITFSPEAVASGETTEVKKDDFDARDIKMSVSGSYLSFKNFLAALEKNPRLVDVVSIDFAGEASQGTEEAAEGERKTYSFSLGLKTYLQKPMQENDAFKLLNAGKFKNFNIDQMSFIKEKVFSDLPSFIDYNVNAGVGEIGNKDIF